jgi:hypothetical protein
LTLGLTPDGRQGLPPPASSKFTSFQRMLRTRQDAERALAKRFKDNNWDITQGPGQGGNPPKNQMNTRVTFDFNKPVGRGFVLDGQPQTRVAMVLDDSVMVEPNDLPEFARERAFAQGLRPGTAEFDARVQQLTNDPRFQVEHQQVMNDGTGVWDGTVPVSNDITRSYTNFVFNDAQKRWVAVQHFPASSPPLFDPNTGLYVIAADASRKR